MPLPPSRVWDVRPLTIIDVGHIKELTLYNLRISPQKDIITENFSRVAKLFEGDATLQHLEKLVLGSFKINSLITCFIRSTTGLKELRLTGFTPTELNYDSQPMSLNHFHAIFICVGSDLQYLKAANLVHLLCARVTRTVYYPPKYWDDNVESIEAPAMLLNQWIYDLARNINHDPSISAELSLEFSVMAPPVIFTSIGQTTSSHTPGSFLLANLMAPTPFSRLWGTGSL